MKLVVLVDNNTYIDEYYVGEPALSYYIEDCGKYILFDTGYSDVCIRNAKALNVDLSLISTIVLSHGHNDHTGGMEYLINQDIPNKYKIVAHPDVFKRRKCNGNYIGSPVSEKDLKEYAELILSKKPIKISENIYFLGEIPVSQEFEQRDAIGYLENDEIEKDYVMDDSAIVYHGENGLFIITGCSHSGICNIIEYAKMVCNERNVIGVIGGFHLFEASEKLNRTINYFQSNNIKEIYPAHCVSLKAKAEIYKSIPIHEVGVGLRIEIR